MFLGTEMGLYATLDAGKSWFKMKNKIPEYILTRDIQIHPVTNDLVIATHGRGIIIVDDISPMRSMTKEIAEKEVVLFPTPPLTLTMGQFGNGGFPNTSGWVAPNPVSIPPLKYYLKERFNTGEIKADIYDAGGTLIQTIPGSKRKGINMLNWNLSMKPPKVATGGTKLDFGALIAPMVLPGDYTLKLTVGDTVLTSVLKVVHDVSNKDFTLEDRKLQYKTAMELYKMHEQLATVVETISEKQKLINDNLTKVKDSTLKRTMISFNDDLEKLRAECLATKQKSIFADEKQLREEITDVYAAICGQEAAPSNLQVQRTVVLLSDVKKKEDANKKLLAKYDKTITDGLKKEGLTGGKKGF